MTSNTAASAEHYQKRAQHHAQVADDLGRRSALLSNFRGLSFGVAVIAALVAAFTDHAALPGGIAAFSALAFGVCVVWHGRVIGANESALRWWMVNQNASLRAGDGWRSLPDQGAGWVNADHPYAGDLDLFGPSSVFQHISVAHTRFGQRSLARILSEPATIALARERQKVVRQLSPELELRQELEACSLALVLPRVWTRNDLKPIPPPDPEPLLRWAESEVLLSLAAWQIGLLRLLPVVTVSVGLAATVMPLPHWAWGIPLVAQVLLLGRFRQQITHTFRSVSQGQGVFAQYDPMLRLLDRFVQKAPELHGLQPGIPREAQAPALAMARFSKLVGWFELRHNPLVHPLINAFLLWDLHCTIALQQWQKQWGKALRQWFEAVGEIEACSSLAGVAFDNPHYAWPELLEGGAVFIAQDLGHPLIAAEARVGNSVSLREPGRALLITGSNMSGKSTLLRAMGVAQVLALAGAPVCATALCTSGLVLRTSVRVSDSLEQGISHFYAELHKLKVVVEAARTGQGVLFLLDEILHGTNSGERQRGARWILAELLQRGAIGAISTHDTGLCALEGDLVERVQQVHFRETVDGERMSFDYKLRPGPVQGGNALRLMRSLGLEVPLE